VKLDYAADNLAGLDRFGRVAEQVWTDYGAEPDEVLDHYTYEYDRAGNPVSVTDPNGDTTTFACDADGNLLRLVDPLGNETTFIDNGDPPASPMEMTGGVSHTVVIAEIAASGGRYLCPCQLAGVDLFRRRAGNGEEGRGCRGRGHVPLLVRRRRAKAIERDVCASWRRAGCLAVGA